MSNLLDRFKPKKYHIIITGPSDFTDYDLLSKTLDDMLTKLNYPRNDLLLLSQGLPETGRLVKRYAKEHGLHFLDYSPNHSFTYYFSPERYYLTGLQCATKFIAFDNKNSCHVCKMIRFAQRMGINPTVINISA